jgi:hypothetical protein
MARKALISDSTFAQVYGKVSDRAGLVSYLKKFKTMRGKTDEEVAMYAALRAHHLRNAGMNLPEFKRGRKPSL